jgi:hypothetical protein
VSVLSNTLVRIKPFRAFIQGSRSTLQGQYLVLNDADVDLAVGGQSAGVSRKDLVIVNVRDSAFSPDTLDSAAIQVVAGTPAASNPAEPTLGGVNLGNYLILGVANVPATGSSVTFTPRTDLATAAAGGVLPAVATDVAVPAYDGQPRYHPTYGLQIGIGGAWRAAADRTIGELSTLTTGLVLAGTPGWTDVLTVAGSSSGGPVAVRWVGAVFNGSSGADRTASYRLTCDGSVISAPAIDTTFAVILAGVPRIPHGQAIVHTPAAGAHTWVLQANASAGVTTISELATLVVVEKRS